MKNKITIVLLILVNSIYSQSLADLDHNNGFKNYKFNTSIENNNNLKLDKEKKVVLGIEDVKDYIYNGKEITNVFGFEIDSMIISFYKNRLSSIGIEFFDYNKDFDLSDFNKLHSYIENIYGTKWAIAEGLDKSVIKGYIWSGNNVTLELLLMNFNSENDTVRLPISCTIHIYHNELNKEMYKSQF